MSIRFSLALHLLPITKTSQQARYWGGDFFLGAYLGTPGLKVQCQTLIDAYHILNIIFITLKLYENLPPKNLFMV